MLLQLKNVSYIYDKGNGHEKYALENINLDIEKGEFIGLVGHTGSGKSTLAQLLNGLEKPTTGSIFLDGKDICEKDYPLSEMRSKVGLVFQYPEHQLFETSVIKDVEFGPKNMGLPLLEVEMRSFNALKMVGIEDDLLDVSPFNLSGGQKRRIAIAGVLAMQPEILILDEPMAGLDPEGRNEILGLLAKLHDEKEITIILISHSMEEVACYASRVVVMNNGKIVLSGKPKDVFRYEDELTHIGLGVPQATKIIHRLRKMGADIPEECVTIEESARAIAEWVKKVKSG